MSGMRAAKNISAEANLPEPRLEGAEIQAMQDVLYDILATGLDPDRSDVQTEEVERFLFEHARTPKSRDEFRAFFAAQGLTVSARASRAPVALRLPPIERSDARGMPARLPVELSMTAEDGPIMIFDDSEITGMRFRRPFRIGLWAACTAAVALLAGAGFYGYTKVGELQGELQRTAEHNQANQAALQALRDHAAGLESSVAATGEMVQRMDQKSDLMLESLIAAEPKSKSTRKRGYAK